MSLSFQQLLNVLDDFVTELVGLELFKKPK
jgi:hypothetical protein